ncbi:tripartite motif-containing protein 16-like [Chanos chanos]|uniref:Tripartite motif-containing protein 16-like n=1 Tax=Chanos chanos TaxID=29144 RepID=A0A6J2WLK6_CHACN|nr:tripartite motif-containing protein 16-like [Chanos chanos]
MGDACSPAQDSLSCPICLDLLRDPVTITCGHSYCMSCIKGYWGPDYDTKVYCCPQCRGTFTQRPVLNKNTTLAELTERLRKTGFQTAPPAVCYVGPGDVECDICTGRKLKAVKSCLVCLASYCETHLQTHYQSPALKKHKLVKASAQLQDRICSQHDKLMEIYCRTDQSMICYLCTMYEHKGHDTASVTAERVEKQKQLAETQRKSQKRIQEREKELQELEQTVKSLRMSAQAAVEDIEDIFAEMVRSIEKRCFEVTEQIRAKENAKVSWVEDHVKKLEQEIAELRKRNAELEQLSHTEDDMDFLQSFQSLSLHSGCKELSSMRIKPVFSFENVKRSVSEMKRSIEKFLYEKVLNAPEKDTTNQIFLCPEPKTREEFLHYSCQLTLDLNTAQRKLFLSEGNRKVTRTHTAQPYPKHPERFHRAGQILCRESLSGRCYWEVEWDGWVYIAVSYKGIDRKGRGNESVFGHNDQSWSLECAPSRYTFKHDIYETKIPVVPNCSRIGVYLDHTAGTLAFYSISDAMTLLHSVKTTFTQPLYAGFRADIHSSVQI